MRVGLIGLGAIGSSLARYAREQAAGEMELVGAVVRDPARSRPGWAPPVVGSVEELLRLTPEVVVEAGGHEALRTYGATILRSGVDLVTVSVGALAEQALFDDLLAAAEAGGSTLQVAPGAIGALDVIGAAAVGGLDRVTHTTTKPAHTLVSPEELATLNGPKEVFRGNARAAALRYPESVNVMAAVSLAGIGMDRTEVRVIADPQAKRNQHVVEVEGHFGNVRFEIHGIPSDENPRTGRITGMSVFHVLRQRRARFRVG